MRLRRYTKHRRGRDFPALSDTAGDGKNVLDVHLRAAYHLRRLAIFATVMSGGSDLISNCSGNVFHEAG